MSYTALRALKVQKTRPDGSVYMEQRKAGDAVPEAAEWRDLPRWVRQGYVQPNEGVHLNPKERGVYKPPVAVPSNGQELDVLPVLGFQHAQQASQVETPVQDDAGVIAEARASLEAMSKKEVIKVARDLKIRLDKDASKAAFIKAILASEAKD